jgi:hypothetical protein
MSLAAVGIFGLLPFTGLRKKSWPFYLGILFAIGMIGCGYTPTSPSTPTPTPSATNYKVLITATRGTQPAASISISLEMQ